MTATTTTEPVLSPAEVEAIPDLTERALAAVKISEQGRALVERGAAIRRAAIIEMSDRGLSYGQIAIRLGVGKTVISKIVNSPTTK